MIRRSITCTDIASPRLHRMQVLFSFIRLFKQTNEQTNKNNNKGRAILSVFLPFCMAERLKRVCVSPRGADAGWIGAKQLACAYFYPRHSGLLGRQRSPRRAAQPGARCPRPHLLPGRAEPGSGPSTSGPAPGARPTPGQRGRVGASPAHTQKASPHSFLVIILICRAPLFLAKERAPSICRNRPRKRYIKTNHND